MGFWYRFNMSFPELKYFMTKGEGAEFVKRFKPGKMLYLYEGGKRLEDSCFLASDVKLFPSGDTTSLIDSYIERLNQSQADAICFNLSNYATEGDLSLTGGDFYGEPPILGNLS